MPTARYKFTRDPRNMAGFLSQQRASTDALNALGRWVERQTGRSYADPPIVDEDDNLVVDLTWRDDDSEAGPDLEAACLNVGLIRSHIPK